MRTSGFHHIAYRCKDAKQTVEFYQQHLGMKFTVAFAEDTVPSTGEESPYMHVFLDAGNNNILAFFELPESPEMGRDQNTPAWVQHIAMRLDTREELLLAKESLVAANIDVLGPVDHGVFDSIYFFDPNGHRLELAVDKGTQEQMLELQNVAEEMLAEWSVTKRAPRHAAWLHQSEQ